MQLRLLALLLLQPERSWTLSALADSLDSPQSSVHRELRRAEDSGLVRRDAASRPHRFFAATEDSLFEPVAALLRQSVGVEEELRAALSRPDVTAAVIHGSWATGARRPDSDIDVLVVGAAPLRELRRIVRPIGKEAGRTIDITVVRADELRRRVKAGSAFARDIIDAPTLPLVGDLTNLVQA